MEEFCIHIYVSLVSSINRPIVDLQLSDSFLKHAVRLVQCEMQYPTMFIPGLHVSNVCCFRTPYSLQMLHITSSIPDRHISQGGGHDLDMCLNLNWLSCQKSPDLNTALRSNPIGGYVDQVKSLRN